MGGFFVERPSNLELRVIFSNLGDQNRKHWVHLKLVNRGFSR